MRSANRIIGENGQVNSLFTDFSKHQPTIVPAAGAGRVTDHLPFGLIQTLGAERIVLRQCAKLAKQVVGVDVVGPGIGHWLGGIRCIGSGKDLLDSTEFGEGIDLVRLQRTDQLSFLVLNMTISKDNYCPLV